MKTFRVYSHPTHGHEAVKEGFSWPAFFFGFFWMMVKRLWGLAGLWFFAYVSLAVIQIVTDAAQSEPGAQALVYLVLVAGYFALWLVPGIKGNSWRLTDLAKRGYELLGEVHAETPDAAVAQAARATQQGDAAGSVARRS
jgi:hypothetical protein